MVKEVIWTNFPVSAGTVALHHIQVAFEELQRWRLHSLSGQPKPVLHHPHSMEVLPGVQKETLVFQFLKGKFPLKAHHTSCPRGFLLLEETSLSIHLQHRCLRSPRRANTSHRIIEWPGLKRNTMII